MSRELYWVTVKYTHPMAGTVQIFADSDEHAKEIVQKAHSAVSDFEILDCYKLSEEQKKEILGKQMEQMEMDFQGEVDKDKLN